jgi:transposase
MAGISVIREREYIRIYRTFSFRNIKNEPQNRRKSIGKIDQSTNKPVFNKYFTDLLSQQGISIDLINSVPLHDIPKYVDFGIFDKQLFIAEDKQHNEENNLQLNTIERPIEAVVGNNAKIDINFSDKKSNNIIYNVNTNKYECIKAECKSQVLGPHLILQKIAEDTSLLPILQAIFPENWDKIITLAYYLVINNESILNLQIWAEKNVTYLNNINLQTQRISELLSSISFEQIINFYEAWANIRTESKYITLDIASISSYSNLIPEVEGGYNRDGEKLEQINVCLLFGEKSGLPVYSSLYPGSLNDVAILKSFLNQSSFFNVENCNLVMDKGFYSKKNIIYLMDKFPNFNFLLAMPFTTKDAKKIILEYSNQFKGTKLFHHGNEFLEGSSIIKELDFKHKIKYHIFYNEYLNHDVITSLKEYAIKLKCNLLQNPHDLINDKEIKRYLLFDQKLPISEENISINMDRIMYETRHRGWLIIAGNDFNINIHDVINIYRNKDVVEKAFNNMKNNLFLNRLRGQSGHNSKSKLFITTIGLIIYTYIHKIMLKNKLYSEYTMNNLLKTLTKAILYKNNGYIYSETPSKEIRNILKFFDIEIID